MVHYPGHDRIEAFRHRMNELRHDTTRALDETAQLRADVEALRREVAQLAIVSGDQMTTLSDAVDQLSRRVAGDRPAAPSAE